ncbi:Tetratricopeptide repeat (TPR)-like superfamily protein [Abeliophyllum distichum]|uniref:Tetratricopeptide repeat (TPR)-like superfamily protein n=1 Tax=Abeliophyllum distichum TaxID=126358 RepID=A0ABD1TGB0_9LAMI
MMLKSLFRTIEDRDVVTWNVMMMGCVQNNNFEEACNYFWMMRREGILPDEASFSTVLHAAASIAALDQGSLMHDQIIKTGFERNTCVSSSLITMYAKCGSLSDARWVFTESEDRNVVLWTATISAWRVDEGFSYFNSMIQKHNISPGPEHYACMVDLLGRAGRLLEAKKFVEAMPIEPDTSIWGALLGACWKYGNLEIGREVANRLFKIEPANPGNYVLLCNMYARAGRLEEADEVRRLMGVNRVRKEPGCSWLDVKNTTFVFTAHDKSHSRTNEIYKMLGKLEELVKHKGYVAEIQYAINNADEYKERSLWYHSEKLALAYGLLVIPEGAPIRIKKNLRTCGDCHTVMKFASEIFRREIIVRDINRFHRFANGLCSCNDYW